MVTQGGRKYAQLLKSIWNDTDWRALSRDAQWLYELLISQSSMNYAGVLDLTIRRWSNLASDTTPADVTRALEELHMAYFVVVDWDTEEVLVRSLIRNDGLWKQARMLMIALNSAAEVQSPRLRFVLAEELRRLPVDQITEGKRDKPEAVREALAHTLLLLDADPGQQLPSGASSQAARRELPRGARYDDAFGGAVGPEGDPDAFSDQAFSTYPQAARREPPREPSRDDAVTTQSSGWGDNPGGPDAADMATEPDDLDPEQVFSQVSRREPPRGAGHPRARARVRHQSPNTNHLSPGTGAASVGNSTTDRERENRDDQPAGPPVPPNAWAVIREVIPAEQPQTVRTELALQVSTLQKSGTAPDVIKDSLTLWLKKPTLGPRALPVIVSEVLKRRNGATGNTKPGGADRAQSILDRTNRLTATTEAPHAQLD
ncbi:hypothetical protein [Rhodococcus qingshengii]|uniref:hypothetical protein n=1 Tax=Rhodococcus qingshengii TaxID=334542 RepID=UPI001F4462DE|nr:hypothetical protein [Rhodococcus qingshengii]